MALHTRLDATTLGDLAAQYGLRLRSHGHLDGGVVNTSYVLTAHDGAWVLTVLEKRSMASAAAYAVYLDSLHGRGFAVPELRRTADGRWIAEAEGKPVVVTRFVDGVTNRRLNETELAEIGATLGRLHESDVVCDLPPCLRVTSADLAGAATFPDRRFAEWLLRRHDEVRSVLDCTLFVAPTHGDLFPDNIITRPDGRLVLVDWEDAAYDVALFDVGMAILGLCCDEALVPRRADALLAGYRSVRELDGMWSDLIDGTVYVGLLAVHNRYIRGRPSFADLARVIDSVRAY